MFCICMFFCECMATTQSTIPSLSQSTTQSLINVQRKDNSEPLKIGTIVHYSGTQTIFRVEYVLNNGSVEFDNDSTNTYYVSQMVLVCAYAYNETFRFYLDDIYMSAWIIPSEGHFYSSEQSIVKGYYKYLGNYTYKTIYKNLDGSPIYKTVRVFSEVYKPKDNTK